MVSSFQKSEVNRILERAGYPVAELQWTTAAEFPYRARELAPSQMPDDADVCWCPKTGCYFSFAFRHREIRGVFSPSRTFVRASYLVESWLHVPGFLYIWAEELAEEYKHEPVWSAAEDDSGGRNLLKRSQLNLVGQSLREAGIALDEFKCHTTGPSVIFTHVPTALSFSLSSQNWQNFDGEYYPGEVNFKGLNWVQVVNKFQEWGKALREEVKLRELSESERQELERQKLEEERLRAQEEEALRLREEEERVEREQAEREEREERERQEQLERERLEQQEREAEAERLRQEEEAQRQEDERLAQERAEQEERERLEREERERQQQLEREEQERLEREQREEQERREREEREAAERRLQEERERLQWEEGAWYVRSLHLENIRNFEKLDLYFSQQPRRCGMLIGRNGTGKSTVLQALAIGLCDNMAAAALLRSPGASNLLRQQTEQGLIKLGLEGPDGRHETVRTVIRRDVHGEYLERTGRVPRALVVGFGAFRSPGGHLPKAYCQVAACASLVETEPRLPVSVSSADILEELRLPDGDSGGPRLARAWVGALARWTELAGRSHGLLLVDEFMQHLHPSAHVDFLDSLLEAFPQMQLIATSMSSELQVSLAAGELLVLR